MLSNQHPQPQSLPQSLPQPQPLLPPQQQNRRRRIRMIQQQLPPPKPLFKHMLFHLISVSVWLILCGMGETGERGAEDFLSGRLSRRIGAARVRARKLSC